MNRFLGCLLAFGFLMLASGVALQILQKPVPQPSSTPPFEAPISRPAPVAPSAPVLISSPVVANNPVPMQKKTPKPLSPKAKKPVLPHKIAAKLHMLLPGVPLPAPVQVSTSTVR